MCWRSSSRPVPTCRRETGGRNRRALTSFFSLHGFLGRRLFGRTRRIRRRRRSKRRSVRTRPGGSAGRDRDRLDDEALQRPDSHGQFLTSVHCLLLVHVQSPSRQAEPAHPRCTHCHIQLYQIRTWFGEGTSLHLKNQLYQHFPIGEVQAPNLGRSHQFVAGSKEDVDEKWHVSQTPSELGEHAEPFLNVRVRIRTNRVCIRLSG